MTDSTLNSITPSARRTRAPGERPRRGCVLDGMSPDSPATSRVVTTTSPGTGLCRRPGICRRGFGSAEVSQHRYWAFCILCCLSDPREVSGMISRVNRETCSGGTHQHQRLRAGQFFHSYSGGPQRGDNFRAALLSSAMLVRMAMCLACPYGDLGLWCGDLRSYTTYFSSLGCFAFP